MKLLEEKYKKLCSTKSDINEHLPTLRKYASNCEHITEMGVRSIVSTWALLAAQPKTLISYDKKNPLEFNANINEVYDLKNNTNFKFIQNDVLNVTIEETDLLFIDTWHVYKQLIQELKLHSSRVKKYIILHDTETFGVNGEFGGEGLIKAIDEFLNENSKWVRKEVYKNNNGLTILKRIKN